MKNTKLSLIFTLVLLFFSGCGGSGDTTSNKPSAVDGKITSNLITITNGEFKDATPTIAKVGIHGGTVEINDPSSPLNGVKIVIPVGAVSEDIDLTIGYADITGSVGMPDGSFLADKMIRIAASGSDGWNEYQMFDKLVEVTLPYKVPPASVAEGSLFYYYYNSGNKTLESEGFTKIDRVKKTITFKTRSFAQTAVEDTQVATRSISSRAHIGSYSNYATYINAGILIETLVELEEKDIVIDTGFRAAKNGWFIPNYGSYYDKANGGVCMGMVAFAKYYHKYGYSPQLYSNYRDSVPTQRWQDDSTAIEIVSRVHSRLANIVSEIRDEEGEQKVSSLDVALSLVGSLFITNNLTKIGIYKDVFLERERIPGTVNSYYRAEYIKDKGHEVSTYRVDFKNGEIVFHVYDPNNSNDDTRRIVYKIGSYFDDYLGGTSTSSKRIAYNLFYHSGFRVGLTDAVMQKIKDSADAGFKDDSKFPTIEITSIVGKNSGEVVYDKNDKGSAKEGLTALEQHKYITSDTAVVVKGTLLGGLAQSKCCIADNLRIFYGNKKHFQTPVDNYLGGGTGEFTFTLPVLQGENMFILMGAKRKSFYSNWSAFKFDIIESTHSPAHIGVTLTWSKGQSDIDLYVKEPDSIDGVKTGQTVSYTHREGLSVTNPYLDVDNTDGYGPEHYIGIEGMSTLFTDGSANPEGMYGSYSIRVHYFADHDSDEDEVQPVPWYLTWRYLRYCEMPCENPGRDGIWETQRRGGVLTSEKEFSYWDTMNYRKLDPEKIKNPTSHDVMLP